MNNLPNDILLEVFKHLPGKSLKNSALVCRNWNEIISSSSSTMNNFKLSIRKWFDAAADKKILNSRECAVMEEFEELISTHRKFTCITLNFLKIEQSEKILQCRVLNYFGRNIKKLTLVGVECDFNILLKKLGTLETLEIKNCSMTNPVDDKIKLSNLKKLYFFESNHEILEILYCPQLTFVSFFEIDLSLESCRNFLANVKSLKTFEFHGKHEMFLQSPFDKFTFKLRKIYLSFFSNQEEINEKNEMNVIEFVKSQSKFVEDLDLFFACSKEILNSRTKFKILQKLRIDEENVSLNKK